MAITKKLESTATSLSLIMDNGDLRALVEVIEKFGFVDEQAALRFALLKAEKNVIYVDQGDKKVVLSPSSSILKTPQPDEVR